MNAWRAMLCALLGEPLPPPPALPGRVHVAHDEPLPAAELAAIDNPTELALCAGITRQAAAQRLQARRKDLTK